jgi:flagellar hook-basal body complex protein FliE
LLKEKLANLIAELKKKEVEVLSEEKIIKAEHLKIEQRQLTVDRLNRQFAELSKDGQDEEKDNGPLEIELQNVIKQINDEQTKASEANKNWITNQKELIDEQAKMDEIQRGIDELRTRKTVLEQKRIRLNNNVETHNKEIRELQVALKNLDFEMNKLNDLFYKNKSRTEVLTNANFNIENEFQQKLKELENETIKLED